MGSSIAPLDCLLVSLFPLSTGDYAVGGTGKNHPVYFFAVLVHTYDVCIFFRALEDFHLNLNISCLCQEVSFLLRYLVLIDVVNCDHAATIRFFHSPCSALFDEDLVEAFVSVFFGDCCANLFGFIPQLLFSSVFPH